MPQHPTVVLPDLPAQPPAVPAGERGFSPALPLRGITVLLVEDSRFASEALRLMCQRLGARLRRADSLHSARAHLRLYRPDVVIIDLGLPDGRGEGLIHDIAQAPHPPIVLGTSGDAEGRAQALAAGAAGFLDKPLESLAAFQSSLLRHLPDRPLAQAPADAPLAPDALALRDDLAHAAGLIDAGLSEAGGHYLTGFLSGVAAHAHDQDLAAALRDPAPEDQRLARIRPLLDHRLAGAAPAFGQTDG